MTEPESVRPEAPCPCVPEALHGRAHAVRRALRKSRVLDAPCLRAVKEVMIGELERSLHSHTPPSRVPWPPQSIKQISCA
jgi:hypothetical protein